MRTFRRMLSGINSVLGVQTGVSLFHWTSIYTDNVECAAEV